MYIQGILLFTQTSLIKNLVCILSVPSNTRSTPLMIFSAFIWFKSLTIASISTSEFTLFSFSTAATAFGIPMSSSSKSICRWRLFNSTKSRSIIDILPTPARTRLFATTVPRAPHPMMAILLFKSVFCPSSPIFGNITCLEYLSCISSPHSYIYSFFFLSQTQ